MSCDSCASAPSLCGTVPKPALHDLAPTVMTNLAALGVTELSVLHRELLQTVSNNVVLQAPVASGNVLALALVALQRDSEAHAAEAATPGLRIFVISPRRESAAQIESMFQALAKGLPRCKTALLVGGVPQPPQIHRLEDPSVCIGVGTPGRVVELLAEFPKHTCFNSLHSLIVHDSDTLLRGTFMEQLELITSQVPQACRILFNSTTPDVRCVRAFLEKCRRSLDFAHVIVTDTGDVHTVSRSRDAACDSVDPLVSIISKPIAISCVEHVVWAPDYKDRRKRLFALLQDARKCMPPVMIRVESVEATSLLAERVRLIHELRSGMLTVIVTTSTSAAAFDFVTLKPQIIIYDFPSVFTEYTVALGSCHALKPAYVFVGDADSRHVEALITHLNGRGQFVSAELYRASARASAAASTGTVITAAAGTLKRAPPTPTTYTSARQKAVKLRFS